MNILLDNIIWLLTVFLFVSFFAFHTHAALKVILLCVVLVLIFFILIRHNFRLRIKITYFHIGILLFSIFCFLSSFWAWDSDAAITQSKTILQILLFMSVLYAHYEYKQSTIELLDAIRWAGYVVAIYTISFYGIKELSSLFLSASRLKGEFANTNSISMFVTFATLLSVYKYLYYKFSWENIFLFPCIIVIAACGSRKGIIMLFAGIFLIFIFRYASKNLFKNMLKILFSILICFFIFKFLLTLPIFDIVNHRMEGFISALSGGDVSDRSSLMRIEMIRIGWNQFKKTPILGMGQGNSYILTEQNFGENLTYLHNNCIDLLASGGIVGTLLYYTIWFYPLYFLIRFFKIHNKETSACLMMIILLLTILDWGQVGYTSKITYVYLMVFYLQVSILKQEIKKGGI